MEVIQRGVQLRVRAATLPASHRPPLPMYPVLISLFRTLNVLFIGCSVMLSLGCFGVRVNEQASCYQESGSKQYLSNKYFNLQGVALYCPLIGT